MTAVLAAFSLQHEIEHYGAYAGIAAVFGLGILSLLYFAQAREVKRLREWAGRAPERAAELEARVTADAQRRVAPPVQPTPRPTAPVTPAAQQSAAPPTPGIAAPTTAAAATAGAPATTVAKPDTTAPQNGTGSGAAVPPPGTEDKPEEAKPQDGEAKKPEDTGATPAVEEPKPFGPQPKPAAPEAKPPVPAATAAAGAPAAPPAPAPAAPAPRPSAPLRAPVPSASLPPRTPAGARARADADDGRSRGRVAAIVGGVLGVIAVVAVAGILIFGGGGDEPTPPPNTVAQPTTGDADSANGTATPKTPVKVNRKAVPLAVLNGTTVTGLARGAADKLTTKGYNEPNVVTNDTTNQARPTTQIYYEAKVRAAALDVAKILGVPTAQVKPMDANARALADRAEVAVFVGADKAQ
jgi:hypothetical protein